MPVTIAVNKHLEQTLPCQCFKVSCLHNYLFWPAMATQKGQLCQNVRLLPAVHSEWSELIYVGGLLCASWGTGCDISCKEFRETSEFNHVQCYRRIQCLTQAKCSSGWNIIMRNALQIMLNPDIDHTESYFSPRTRFCKLYFHLHIGNRSWTKELLTWGIQAQTRSLWHGKGTEFLMRGQTVSDASGTHCTLICARQAPSRLI